MPPYCLPIKVELVESDAFDAAQATIAIRVCLETFRSLGAAPNHASVREAFRWALDISPPPEPIPAPDPLIRYGFRTGNYAA